MLQQQDTRPRITGGQGGTDYFDTIIPGGGLEQNTIEWQQGLRRAYTRGRSYFQHFLKRGGVPPDMIELHTADLYTGRPRDRKHFRGMAGQGGYHGHKAQFDQMKAQRARPGQQGPQGQPGPINQPGPQQLNQQLSRFGYTRPSAHAQNRLGEDGPAYRAGSWEDTQMIPYHEQNVGGYGPGGMIKPGLGMGGYGPNFGPHGKLNPNIGRRVGDTHHSPHNMGGYGPGGTVNPNAPPGHIRGRPLIRRR